MSVKVQKITEPVVIGEGPHWDAQHEVLYFINCFRPATIHKFVPATGKHTKITPDTDHIGFVIPVEGTSDQFLVGVNRNFLVVKWDGEEGSPATVVKEIGEVDQDVITTRLNDAKADPKGRVFSANLKYIFDFDKNNIPGIPDGCTIDTGGNLWVAVFNGSCVLHIDPRTGSLIRKIAIPALQVTSVTFGGPDHDILFVTSGSMTIHGQVQEPPCGATFMVTGLGVRGFPSFNYKI